MTGSAGMWLPKGASALSDEPLRMTRQREVILEEVRRTESHPTADELYDVVRRRLPRISLGTVYRNLEELSSRGLVHKLEMGGDQKRFDGNVRPHQHVRCTHCGRVADILQGDGSAEGDLLRSSGLRSDFRILGCRVEWYGICPGCNGCSADKGEATKEAV